MEGLGRGTSVNEQNTWRHSPYREGPFETGCFTFAGNDLVLFIDTTRQLAETRDGLFETVFKRCHLFKDQPWPAKDARGRWVTPPDMTGKPWRWAIVNGGPHVPTLVAEELEPLVRRYLITPALKLWAKEIGEHFDESEDYFRDDVCNYMMRSFERWLNEVKVQVVA